MPTTTLFSSLTAELPSLRAHALIRRAADAPRINLKGYVQIAQQLREKAQAGEWSRLHSLSAEIGGRAKQSVEDTLPQLFNVSLMRAEPTRTIAGRPVPAFAPAFIDSVESRMQYQFGCQLALVVDAQLARLHADFNAAFRNGGGRLPDSADGDLFAPMAAEMKAFTDGRLRSFYDLLRSDDVDGLNTATLDVLQRVPVLQSDAALLLALLYRDVSAPFSATGHTTPRLWQARAALALHVETRRLLQLFAAAGYLRGSAIVGLAAGKIPEIAARARALAFDAAVDAAETVTVARLTSDPTDYEGKLVTTEGVIKAIEFERVGRKYNTFVTLMPDFSDTRVVRARAHFQNLLKLGICERSYVRLTGHFSKAFDWSANAPALDLDRPALSGSTGWVDRLQLALRPWFEAEPRGLRIAWTLSPHTARVGVPGLRGAAELVHRKVMRIKP